MTLHEAEQFLSSTTVANSQPSLWADLGCGDGLFTKVLSSRLHDGSTICAIDKSSQPNITSVNNNVKIITKKADFVNDNLPLGDLDGILIANALHYVEDKQTLLKKLKIYLIPTGVFIIIEYDNAKPNHWVPYPVSFSQLRDLFEEAGYQNIEKTGERKSIYQSGKMYVCSIQP